MIVKLSLAAGAMLLLLSIAMCAEVEAAPPDSCAFGVVSGVNFGNYDVFNVLPTTANGTLTFSCANFPAAGEVVNVRFSRGNAPTYNPRFMLGGGQQLQYNLYTDAGYANIWGNGTDGTSFYSHNTLNGVVTTLTIFGRIPAGQDLPAGPYSDTITVTMEW